MASANIVEGRVTHCDRMVILSQWVGLIYV